MKIKKYGFALAVAILTFAFGVSVYTSVRIAVSLLSSLVWKEAVIAQPVVEIEQAQSVETKEIVPMVVGLQEDSEDVTEAEPQHEFDPSGEYYMVDESKAKGFEDFEFVEIWMRDYDKQTDDGAWGVPIPPKGSVQTKKAFKFKRIAIGGKEITFQTEEINGISYKFTGRFWDERYENDELPPDLAGRLIKFKNGVWDASTHAKFYMPGC